MLEELFEFLTSSLSKKKLAKHKYKSKKIKLKILCCELENMTIFCKYYFDYYYIKK